MSTRDLLSAVTDGSSGSTTITYVTSVTTSVDASSGTSTSVTVPASVTSNDILIAYATTGNSSSSTPPTQTTPPGYVKLVGTTSYSTGSSDAENACVYYKVASPTDAGSSFVVTSTTSDYRAIAFLVFRSSSGSTPVLSFSTPTAYGSAPSTSNPPNQTILSGSASAPVVAFATYLNTASRSFSYVPNTSVTTSNGRRVTHRIFNASPQNVTVGATTTSSTVVLQSFYMVVS